MHKEEVALSVNDGQLSQMCGDYNLMFLRNYTVHDHLKANWYNLLAGSKKVCPCISVAAMTHKMT